MPRGHQGQVPLTRIVLGVTTGEIVYFDRKRWAMVVGKSDTRIAIRERGYGTKDQLVPVSQLLRVR